MKVSELMTTPPVCVAPHDSLAEATRLMAQSAIGSLLVIEVGALRGIVTDRDIALRGLGGGLASETRVDAVMSTQVTVVHVNDDLQVAYQTFRRTGVRRLPVLSEGEAVGVLTIDDLFLDVLRRLADLLGPVAWSVLREPPGPPPDGGDSVEP